MAEKKDTATEMGDEEEALLRGGMAELTVEGEEELLASPAAYLTMSVEAVVEEREEGEATPYEEEELEEEGEKGKEQDLEEGEWMEEGGEERATVATESKGVGEEEARKPQREKIALKARRAARRPRWNGNFFWEDCNWSFNSWGDVRAHSQKR